MKFTQCWGCAWAWLQTMGTHLFLSNWPNTIEQPALSSVRNPSAQNLRWSWTRVIPMSWQISKSNCTWIYQRTQQGTWGYESLGNYESMITLLILWNNPHFWHTNRFKAINIIVASKADQLKYWNHKDGKWEKVTPSKQHIYCVKSLFHEVLTTFMTEDFGTSQLVEGEQIVSMEKADKRCTSVDKTYCCYSLANGNVYVTGVGLLPTTRSWNCIFHLSIKIPVPNHWQWFLWSCHVYQHRFLHHY